MALVDTGPLTVAVDRSLLGPQGRRWIERKLPEVVSNVAFIFASAFGACILMYYVCLDYQRDGLIHGLSCLPKHFANGVALHLIAKILHWHIGRSIRYAFVPDDAPDVFSKWALDAISSHGKSKANAESSELENSPQLPWSFATSHVESPENQVRRKSSDDKANLPKSGSEHIPLLATRSKEEEPLLTPNLSSSHKRVDSMNCEAYLASAANSPCYGSGRRSQIESPDRSQDISSDQKKSEVAPDAGTLREAKEVGGKGKQSSSYSLGVKKTSASKGSNSNVKCYTVETTDELFGNLFFIKVVDVDGWMFVDDRLYEPKEVIGIGKLLNLFHRGYHVGVKYADDVGPENAHRMLFKAEPGRIFDHIKFRSRGSNTLLFMLGLKRPLTLVAWDHEVFGGEAEDMKILWLPAPYNKGELLIWSRVASGFLQWSGENFIHTSFAESASRFMLQCLK